MVMSVVQQNILLLLLCALELIQMLKLSPPVGDVGATHLLRHQAGGENRQT